MIEKNLNNYFILSIDNIIKYHHRKKQSNST